MRTTVKNNLESVIEYLESLSDGEIVGINNEYCRSVNYNDDEIYSNDEEFFEVFFANKVVEAVRAASYGEYNFGHNWVKFNGYGNLESFDNPFNNIDVNEIATYILENPNEFNIELEEEETEE